MMDELFNKKPNILGFKENGEPVIESDKISQESEEELRRRYRKEKLEEILNRHMPDYNQRINEAESPEEIDRLEKRRDLFLKLFTQTDEGV